ncbi:Protein kinase domain-containing protein [Aphelenchoides fujianensis]|nr:Protein kinase domain-containing protein [Aphelenchoides fujianensis]
MATSADESEAKPPPPDEPSPPSSSANPREPSPAVPNADEEKDGGGSDSDGDGAEEILEESPDKRWSKRREKVKQRDVPGIDAAFLAMDNEAGTEVVWNEVQFSERKNFREQEEKLKSVFDNLTRLTHVNLVKFHKYWTESKADKPRIIFITEYMSSSSMFRFLHRARSSGSPLSLKIWKKWTTQILSALNYLHSCDPPIMATTGGLCGNGTGSECTSQVTPDVIRKAIEGLEDQKQRNFIESCLNPDPDKRPTARQLLFHEALFEVHSLKLLAAHAIVASKLIDHLSEDDLRVPDASRVAAVSKQKELTYSEQKSFQFDLDKFLEDVRNGIYPLIAFAPLAHMPARIDNSASVVALASSEGSSKAVLNTQPDTTPAQTPTSAKTSEHSLPPAESNRPSPNEAPKPQPAVFSIGESPTPPAPAVPPKVEPIPNSALLQPTSAAVIRDEGYDTAQSVLNNLSGSQSAKELSDKPYKETRSIVSMQATVEGNVLKAVLQLDDHMNRQLVTEIHANDNAEGLVADLVEFGFISEQDSAKMCGLLRPVLEAFRLQQEARTDSGKSSRKSSRQQEAGTVVNAEGGEPEAADSTAAARRPPAGHQRAAAPATFLSSFRLHIRWILSSCSYSRPFRIDPLARQIYALLSFPSL